MASVSLASELRAATEASLKGCVTAVAGAMVPVLACSAVGMATDMSSRPSSDSNIGRDSAWRAAGFLAATWRRLRGWDRRLLLFAAAAFMAILVRGRQVHLPARPFLAGCQWIANAAAERTERPR